MWIRRLGLSYKTLALLSLNTLIVLLLINLASVVVLSLFRDQWAPPGPLQYGTEKLLQAYPGKDQHEIEQLLRESWSSKYVYAPFVQHREPARPGRFVNVAEEGFRLSSDQGPWPPEEQALNLFVFGGSTTFGYGVADDETIPSRLQAALAGKTCGRPPQVYNFGRGNYYGEQERVLFEGLLATGAVPDVALFIDGLNEWKTAPKFTARLKYLLQESDGQLALRGIKTLPVVRLLKAVRDARASDSEAAGAPRDDQADRQLAQEVMLRWLRNKRMLEAVGAEFEVLPIFVWQPVPTWEYDMDSHLFAAESAAALARHGPLRHGYRAMDHSRSSTPALQPGGNFLWLADIQRGRREPLYVDAAHYTAAFSDEIARHIAEFVGARLPCAAAGRR